jgi:FkbM family methyltransferase
MPIAAHERLSRLAGRSALARRAAAALLGDVNEREVQIARGGGAGLRFDAAGSMHTYALGAAEPRIQQALTDALAPGMTVYDIGCNVGFFTIIAARAVGPTGRVLGFDPVPANVLATRRNAELNGQANVELHTVAVGARDGAGSFLVDARSSGWGRLVAAGAGTLEVDVVALDGRIAAGELPVPDVIKLDVEGGEVDALAGLTRTLREHRPVLLVEVHVTGPAVRAALSPGYDLRRLDPAGPDDNAHYLATPRARCGSLR